LQIRFDVNACWLFIKEPSKLSVYYTLKDAHLYCAEVTMYLRRSVVLLNLFKCRLLWLYRQERDCRRRNLNITLLTWKKL